VVTVYAAAAFVILELVSIIVEPLKLPDWLLAVVFVFLCIGLVLAVILSWIYDIHPDGNIVKTGPVEKVEDKKTYTSNGWKFASYLSFVVILGLILVNILSRGNNSREILALEKSIAVLPFTNLSTDEENQYFADGLVEDLLNRISVIEELKVVSRTSSDMYRERGIKGVPEIVRELGNISCIVEGSVQKYGNKARISVQLIDAINDNNIWAEKYDRDLVDILSMQSEIAGHIASNLNMILTTAQKSHIQENKTRNIKAFELYQMGRFYLYKRTEDDLIKSVEYFNRAIDEDPGYGLAYAGLADAYGIMSTFGWIDSQGGDRAKDLALKALELDGNLAEAYGVIGNYYHINWEWERAEKAFKHAVKLNPNYSIAYMYYAHLLNTTQHTSEARKHIDIALELDPLSFINRLVSARFYYHDGLFIKALEELRICNELQSDHPWIPQKEFMNYRQLGEDDKAYGAFRKILNNSVIYDAETADSIFKDHGLEAVIEWKLDMDTKDAENPLSSPYSLAELYAMIGEEKKALYWLEKAFDLHQTTQMPWNLNFKNLRDHPGYNAILEKMGLALQ
jgi:TolB-like protein